MRECQLPLEGLEGDVSSTMTAALADGLWLDAMCAGPSVANKTVCSPLSRIQEAFGGSFASLGS